MLRVGERLAQERKRQGLSIEDVAKSTKIRSEFLVAIEKGEYKKLPSSAYIQGFIKNYAQFLNLPVKETAAIFKREFDEREYLGVLPDSFTKKQKNILSGFRLGPTALLLGIVMIFILGYTAYQYRAAFLSPMLTISVPSENAVISTQSVTVIGKSDASATVTINDVPVYVDHDGNFRKDVSVFSGETVITIKAENSFGKITTVLRHISVE